jgi:NAD(P)-dependent dehydrogenase (short-subunit alcohol dehydrogenase family)
MAKVLITGASGGFGKLTVETLIKKNHQVAASMRGVKDKNKKAAEELTKLGAKVIEMDVTQDNSVNAGVEQTLKVLGDLDVVINNAGIGVLGVQETFTPDDWQKLFNVNVFGVQRVNRAVLPHLRAKRSGLILHVSSLLGRIAIPFYGPYNSSKWALEAMCENYRVELSGFGVDVGIIEPGGYPTTFIDNLLLPSDKSREATLGELQKQAEVFLKGFEQALAGNPAQNPQNVADAIVKVIDTPAGRREFRTIVDKMGMADAVQPYNEHLEKVMSGIYTAFGMAQMRQLKT